MKKAAASKGFCGAATFKNDLINYLSNNIKNLIMKTLSNSLKTFMALIFTFLLLCSFTLVSSFSNGVQTTSGCVNGPNVHAYCFNDSGEYACKSYWIWNCITAVNEEPE